jgi:hypothetical protein
MSSERFEVVLDPAGAWCVWDVQAGRPAHIAGSTLFGLRRAQAEAFYRLLALRREPSPEPAVRDLPAGPAIARTSLRVL